MNDKCGDCVFLEKNDDFPYCVTLPLYTERSPKDKACECFVGVHDPKWEEPPTNLPEARCQALGKDVSRQGTTSRKGGWGNE